MSAHPARGVSTGIGRPVRASQRRVRRFAHALQSMCSTSGGWIFPCDPQFGLKAGRILDLYERRWQARRRRHPSQPPAPGRSQRVEHEYTRPAPGPISPRGMCIARACSAAVKSRRASFPSTGSWRTSCGRNRIARLVASFGLRTTAPRIGASARWRGCRPRGRSSFVSNSTTSTRRSRSSGRSRGAISSRCSPSSVVALHGRRREYVAIIANWST